MARKRYTTEQIIGMLREAEVKLSQGETVKWVLEKSPTALSATSALGQPKKSPMRAATADRALATLPATSQKYSLRTRVSLLA